MLLLCVIICAVSIWSSYYKVANVSKKEIEIEKLKAEALVLKDSIGMKNFELNLKSDSIAIMVAKYNSINPKNVKEQINKHYDNEKNRITNLPVDSTVSNLSRWLSEADKNK